MLRIDKAESKLKESAETVSTYPEGGAIASRRIEQAYATSLAILVSRGMVSPKLAVPKEHFTNIENARWDSTIDYYRSNDVIDVEEPHAAPAPSA